jgi:hypothetical protein
MPAITHRGLRVAIVRYARLPRTQRVSTVEASVELVRAYVLVRILGWSRYSRTLGTAQPGDPVLSWDGDRTEARTVGRAVDRWRWVAPRAATCLMRAIAGQRMLTRRGIPSALVLGLRVDDEGIGAHGWLRVGAEVVIGEEEMAGHEPVAHFGAGTTDRPQRQTRRVNSRRLG